MSMPDPFQHILTLANEIGPRKPTSENEKKAAEYIKNTFRNMGLKPTVDEFKTLPTFSWTYILIFGLFIVSFIVYYFDILLGFLISLISLVFLIAEGSSKEVITKILPKGTSQNIWTEIKAKNMTMKKIILVGHYDSSRAAWFFNPKYVSRFRLLFISMLTSAIVITILYLIGCCSYYFFESSFMGYSLHTLMWYISIVPLFFAILGFVSMIHRELFHKDVPGANDNASGVSIVLSLAEILSKEPLNNTDVICLATGSEESGMFGMIRFLEKYGDQLKDAYIINFDNLGIGDSYYVIGEGIIATLKSYPELVEIAEKVAKENPDLGFKPKVYKLLPTDATPAIARGFKAISIMSFDKKGLLPHWHWYSDIPDNIEKNTLQRVLTFAIKMIKKIDAS